MKFFFSRLTLACSLLGFVQPLMAQDATVSWSEDLIFGKNITVEQFVGLQGSDMFLQTHKNSAGVKISLDGLQRSFKQMQNIGSINLNSLSAAEQGSITVADKGASLLGIVLTKNKKWFFAKNNVEKTDLTLIKAYQLNSNMQVKGAPIELHTFTKGFSKDTDFGYTNTENDPDTRLILSADSSKIGIVIEYGNWFLCKVFDANTMKLLWEKQTKVVMKRSFRVPNVQLTNDGKVYFVGKNYTSGKERFSVFQGVKTYYTPIENEESMFFAFEAERESVKRTSLGLENAEIASNYTNILKNGNLAIIVSYFLADKKGFAYYEIDKEDRVVNKFQIIPAPDKIKNLYKHAYDRTHKGVINNAYNIQNAVFKEDGSMLLSLSVSLDFSSPEQETYSDYDDILLSVNNKGGLTWATAIPRGKTVINHRLRGLQSIFYKNSMYYIYTDTRKNIVQEVGKSVIYPPMLSPNYQTAIAKIDANGVLTRRILDENVKYLFLPTCSAVLPDSGEFICLTESRVGELGAKYKIARVKIAD
jgi:hypothetical protein